MALAVIFNACSSSSTYLGGIGAYKEYEGFNSHLRNYKDDRGNAAPSKFPKDHPHSSKMGKARDSEAIRRATMRPYQINGKWYYPTTVMVGESFDGIASWYGPNFHSKATSNGEIYDMHLHTAAHKTLPMNTIVKVYSKDSRRTTIVRINDRGPFVAGRIIDLSYAAAKDIDMVAKGTARVNIEVIGFHGVISKDAINKSKELEKVTNLKAMQKEFKSEVIDKQLTSTSDFLVQIGAFRNEVGAKQFAGMHKFRHYQTIVKKQELDNLPIFRVFVSAFLSLNEARDFIVEHKIDGFVISE